MSKLEDKLAASIKPIPRTIPVGKSVATATPQRVQASMFRPVAAVPDLNDAHRPLHPDRIWPD